jgi:hypothetical protein
MSELDQVEGEYECRTFLGKRIANILSAFEVKGDLL